MHQGVAEAFVALLEVLPVLWGSSAQGFGGYSDIKTRKSTSVISQFHISS